MVKRPNQTNKLCGVSVIGAGFILGSNFPFWKVKMAEKSGVLNITAPTGYGL